MSDDITTSCPRGSVDWLARIDDLTRKIREIINNAKIRHPLAANATKWNPICSALDGIGDTVLAVRAYFEQEDAGDIGALYLGVYGVLQACYVQQNAIKEGLCDPFDVNIDLTQLPYCQRVRDLSLSPCAGQIPA